MTSLNSINGYTGDEYEDALQYLYDRLPVYHHSGGDAYKPGLENTVKLLTSLHQPQKTYPTIHIAGTNGKGSVSHFLSAIFQKAGYKVGLYTSPHLVDFGERIKINGKMIDRSYLIDFIYNNKNLIELVSPSFFEATMAMAFKYFADNKIDIAIIEVGLGGRLDSTNIIEPVLSVITNISFDHESFLGDTLEKIAFEKAGIIKLNTPVVIGEFQNETLDVFKNKALEMNATLILNDKIIKHGSNEETEKMKVLIEGGDQFYSGLAGEYQLKNIGTVLTTVEVYNKIIQSKNVSGSVMFEDFNCKNEIHNNAIIDGIENVVKITGLQGRWQLLNESPKVIADTGHNVAGINYVTQQLKKMQFNKLHFIMGMANDKDMDNVLKLLPVDAKYYFTQAAIKRAMPSESLAALAKLKGLLGEEFSSVKNAVHAAMNAADKNDLIFIGGSNFIVGEAISLFQ